MLFHFRCNISIINEFTNKDYIFLLLLKMPAHEWPHTEANHLLSSLCTGLTTVKHLWRASVGRGLTRNHLYNLLERSSFSFLCYGFTVREVEFSMQPYDRNVRNMTQSLGNINSFNILLAKRTWYSEIEDERNYEMGELSSDSLWLHFWVYLYIYICFCIFTWQFRMSHLGLRTFPQKKRSEDHPTILVYESNHLGFLDSKEDL